MSRRANSATLNQNQKGRGSRLFLSVGVAEQRQPGVRHAGEGHVPIPRMPIADFILSQAGTAFGFLQEMLDVIARTTDLGQRFERCLSGRVGQEIRGIRRFGDGATHHKPLLSKAIGG